MATIAQMKKELIENFGYVESDLKGKKNAELLEILTKEKETAKKADEVLSRGKVQLDDVVEVMAGTDGVIYISKRTQQRWEFDKLGQRDEMTVREIQTMLNQQPRMIRDGWIIICDEEVVKYFKLEKLYETIFDISDINDVFELDVKEFEEVITNTPQGLKDAIATEAIKRYQREELYDTRVMKLIEQHLDVDFSLLD